MNLPNQITMARLFLAIIFFILLSGKVAEGPIALYVAFTVFVVAALSDALDGYLARKRGEQTTFGRIADPLVDKVIVCGAFIFLTAMPTGVRPWMVVVIVGREFLVSGIRSIAESRGIPFGAAWLGKLKTVSQIVAVCIIVFALAYAQQDDAGYPVGGWRVAMAVSVWIAIAMTVISGCDYLVKAKKIFREGDAL